MRLTLFLFFITTIANCQDTIQKTHKPLFENNWFINMEFGNSQLFSPTYYSSKNPLLINELDLSVHFYPYIKLVAGKKIKLHQIEFGLELLTSKNTLTFNTYNGTSHSIEGVGGLIGLTSAYNYSFQLPKNFSIKIGCGLGLGFSAKTNLFPNIDTVSFPILNGTSSGKYYVKDNYSRLAFHVDPQLRINYQISRWVEIYIFGKGQITPYNISSTYAYIELKNDIITTNYATKLYNVVYGLGLQINFQNKQTKEKVKAEYIKEDRKELFIFKKKKRKLFIP
jgi:hypothetical protein